MQTNKRTKIIYWITTGFLALFILPGIFFAGGEMALQGTGHLGIPLWLHWELSIGKFIGAIILIVPFFPKRIKEWAYVAFGIDTISAIIGISVVDGVSVAILFPLFILVLFIISYITYHKLHPGDQ